MANSMTGFGRGMKKTKDENYVVEIKSVNHRFSEVHVHAPKDCLEIEHQISKQITQSFERGKFEVNLKIEGSNPQQKMDIPEAEILARWKELEKLRKKMNSEKEVTLSEV